MSSSSGFIRFTDPLDREQFLLQINAVLGVDHLFTEATDKCMLLYQDLHDTYMHEVRCIAHNFRGEIIDNFTYEPLV